MGRKYWAMLLGFCVIAAVGCFCGAYYVTGKIDQNSEENQQQVQELASEEEPQEQEEQQQPEVQTVSTEQRITPSTKMVYQYYYEEDGVTEIQEDVPPYFLIDLTLNDLLKYYTNWEVLSFSEREVVMRQIVPDESHQNYVVGEQDGYIAVFYQVEKNGIRLHELTDTPVSSLSQEEQQRLAEGILVTGDDNLAKILEDYGS